MKATSKTVAGLVALALSIPTVPSVSMMLAIGVGSASTAPAHGQLTKTPERRRSDELLKQGRKALEANNLEEAQFCLQQVEQLGVRYDNLFQHFVDTPAKLRNDIAQAMGNRPQPPSSRFTPPATGVAQIQPTAGMGAAIENPYVPNVNASDALLSQMTDSAKAQSLRFINEGRAALAQGDATSAIGWYHRALALGATFAPGEDGLRNFGAELVQAGINPQQLIPTVTQQLAQQAIPGAQELAGQVPQVITNALATGAAPIPQNSATSDAAIAPQKMETLKLLAQARMAFDRGDVAGAEQLVRSAQALNVPDSAYAAGEPRPWMMLLDIEQRKRQIERGMGQVANAVGTAAQAGSQVTTAYAQQPLNGGAARRPTARPVQFDQDDPFADVPGLPSIPAPTETTPAPQIPAPTAPAVTGSGLGPETPAQNNFAPIVDAPSRNVTDQPPLSQITSDDPAEPAAESAADRLIRQGEEALDNNDIDGARRYFIRAFAQQDQLDAESRQRLQTYLQDLRVSPIDAPANGDSGVAGGSSAPQLTPAEQQQLRELYSVVSSEQANINQMREKDPTGAWERLKKLRDTISKAEAPERSRRALLSRVDRSLTELETYIEQNKPRIETEERNRKVLAEIEQRRKQRNYVDSTLQEMVDQFNTLMDEQRYAEARVIAKKAQELSPNDPVVELMVWKGHFAQQLATQMNRREKSEAGFRTVMENVHESAIPYDDNDPISFPQRPIWEDLTRSRRRAEREGRARYSDVEMEIHRALKKPVSVDFDGTPLSTAMDTLGKLAGVDIVLDPKGLVAEGVTTDTTVGLTLRKPVSLKSALNLLLEPLRLSYVVQDEVLRVTSEMVRNEDVYTEVYNVADLVIPIPNFNPNGNIGLAAAIHDAHRSQLFGQYGGRTVKTPFVLADNDASSNSVNPLALAQMGQQSSLPSVPMPNQALSGAGGQGGGSQADFDTLIDLIVTTIDPTTWDEVGGAGSIAQFDTNLSLVVSQTQDVHEKILDLLGQLRRLQDLQVTIEVRFITLNDDFFERIGIDFDFNVNDRTGLAQADLVGRDEGPSITIGLDPSGQPTADLDLQFTQNTFASAVPQFGGFDPNSAANFGFAILSDIEAFFVIQAAQGDQRTNVLQAPKVTLFNGQQAFITDSANRPFVTNLIPVVGDFAAAHQPIVTVLSEGTTLSVQAVVSNDRRFVRLTMVPTFSRIGRVDTFTFTGRTTSNSGTAAVDPSDETMTVQNDEETVTEGTTVQLPTLAVTTIQTTVSVPDGGTILLGGIKRMSEGRNEVGVPMFSKLPYINRLFKNVGIGRETQSLMMMVSPRIIIQEEEEARLLGQVNP
ncbi:MAG: hypothetical protein R3E01_32340 [Pirellulaceae bacterium]|nr:hypothetical protein [Planctomycetales bacterium]